jgi:hypothetical protein
MERALASDRRGAIRIATYNIHAAVGPVGATSTASRR